MAYSPKSQKDYNDKCNRITLKYTEKEFDEFIRVIKYCEENKLQKSVYIKSLIKADLDNRGIPYTD